MPASKPLSKISPSQIGSLLECPRCLWLYYREGLARPRAPFPSLPGGFDRLFKKYFDSYRKKNALPPELAGEVREKLFSEAGRLDDWRNTRRGLTAEFPDLGLFVQGAIDDLLVNSRGEFVPIDFKTRGAAPKEDTSAHYDTQLNLYALLFARNGRPIAGYGYLLYFWPTEYGNKIARFDVELEKIEISEGKGLRILKNVAKIIKGPKPKAHADCEFCGYRGDRG